MNKKNIKKTPKRSRKVSTAFPRGSGGGYLTIAREPPTRQFGYLPFGREYIADLPYVENYYISANGTTGLTTLGYIFNGNNAYDPRYDTGGHQPFQYDILASLYERAWVLGAQVELTFSNPSQDGMYVGCRVRAATNSVVTASQTLDYIQELADSMISPLNNTGSQTKAFRFRFKNASVFGVSDATYDELTYSHQTNGSPSAFTVIEPFAVNTVSGTDATVRVNIKITYRIRFTNRVSAPQS